MDRIIVIGCGGSGKSVVTRQLAELLEVPVTHLDGLYYDPDWNPRTNDEFTALQRDLVAQPRWIIDGNYASTLPIRLAAADTVIFLDLPPLVCLGGIVQRRWHYRGGQHPDVGVYDRINLSFIRYILGYRRKMRPRVHALVAEHASQTQLVTLTSRRHAARFIDQIRTTAMTPA
jgi:adenylate kinase family enzyme